MVFNQMEASVGIKPISFHLTETVLFAGELDG